MEYPMSKTPKLAEPVGHFDSELMAYLETVSTRVGKFSNLVTEVEKEAEYIHGYMTQRKDLEAYLNITGRYGTEQDTSYTRALSKFLETGELLGTSTQKIGTLRSTVLDEMTTICTELSQSLVTITQNKVIVWKNQQQRKLCRFPIAGEIHINHLQLYMNHLVALNRKSWSELKSFKKVITKANFLGDEATNTVTDFLNDRLQHNLKNILCESFVVEDQPPQDLKTLVYFTRNPSVTLIASTYLNESNSPVPNVTPWIIRESDAENLMKTGQLLLPEKDKYLVENESQQLEFCENRGRFVATFPKLRVQKRITRERDELSENSDRPKATSKYKIKARASLSAPAKRKNKRPSGNAAIATCGSDPGKVSEEKLCMLFRCVIELDGLSIEMNAMSFPVVILSHWTQVDIGVATFLWDNAFAEVRRLRFQVPSAAPWTDLANLISSRFYDQTGRYLSSDNLSYLKNRILSARENGQATDDEVISWESFCINKLPGKNHSFWKWIFVALKTITKDDKTKTDDEKKTKPKKPDPDAKKTLLKIYQQGHLMGFVSRDKAADLLKNSKIGTFLLRFTETLPGALTISYVAANGEILSSHPTDITEILKVMKWDDLLKWNNLLYLYPNETPKAEAFSEFYPVEQVTDVSNKRMGYREYVKIIPVMLSSAMTERIGTEGNSVQSSSVSDCSEASTSTTTSSNRNGDESSHSSQLQEYSGGVPTSNVNYSNTYQQSTSSVFSQSPVFKPQKPQNVNQQPQTSTGDFFGQQNNSHTANVSSTTGNFPNPNVYESSPPQQESANGAGVPISNFDYNYNSTSEISNQNADTHQNPIFIQQPNLNGIWDSTLDDLNNIADRFSTMPADLTNQDSGTDDLALFNSLIGQ